MGLILDTSILIADEKGKFEMTDFFRQFADPRFFITAITASELLHGVARARDDARRAFRQHHVEQILSNMKVLDFNLAQARLHARLWADLEMRGQMIGTHDLQIAAAALACGHDLATLNLREFQRVTGLRVVDASPFCRP